MVRRVEAIERLLDLVALAYTPLVVLLVGAGGASEHLRQAIWEVLHHWSIWRPRGQLTVGKLRETLMLDGRENRWAWRALLQQPPDRETGVRGGSSKNCSTN